MKKVITILAVLILIAGFAFAADLTLSTSVHRISPVFKIEYDTNSTSQGTVSGTTVTLNDSIADKAIVATFIVSQNGGLDRDNGNEPVSGYSRYGAKGNVGTTVNVQVTCDKFLYYGETGAAQTGTADELFNVPSVTASNGATVSGKLTYAAAQPTVSSNVVTFQPVYHGKKVTDQTIGTLTATWAKVEDAPFGVYKADITISYTAN